MECEKAAVWGGGHLRGEKGPERKGENPGGGKLNRKGGLKKGRLFFKRPKPSGGNEKKKTRFTRETR